MIFIDRSMLKYYLGVRDCFVNKGGINNGYKTIRAI